MVSRTLVELVDDLDGSAADETVSFGLDGQPYEIDLTSAHADRLRGVLGEWASSARRVPGQGGPVRRPGRASRSAAAGGEDSGAVRLWAREHGYTVSERGRISREVLEAFRAAGA